MKKTFLFLLFSVFITGLVYSAVLQANPTIEGGWKYEVPSAPYEYQKGIITFKDDNSVVSGEVMFSSGNKTGLKNISLKDNTLKLGLYVDSEYITLTAKVTGNKMEGVVNTPDGEMAFKAEKILKSDIK